MPAARAAEHRGRDREPAEGDDHARALDAEQRRGQGHPRDDRDHCGGKRADECRGRDDGDHRKGDADRGEALNRIVLNLGGERCGHRQVVGRE